MNQVTEGKIPVTGGNVWYRITGRSTGIPLLVMHGGPGSSSVEDDVLRTLSDERPVIHYDQLGSGHSDRPHDPTLWNMARFVEELGQVRAALHLDEVHLLGHSWGTMLAASYLLTQPAGVKSVIFSSPALSARLWETDQREYLKAFPETIQHAVEKNEREGTTNAKDYQEAMMAFYHRHFCRLEPWPNALAQMMDDMNVDVYGTMWGASEFTVTGSLRTYDATNQLHEIKLPSLFLCGRYDEATPHTTQYYASLIPDSEFHVFEHSSHMTFLEEPEAYAAKVRSFLNRHE
jgi:proline iminopeptidase